MRKNTMTKTRVQSVTRTKLVVATLAMLAAGGAALATVPLSQNLSFSPKVVLKPDLVIKDIIVSSALAGNRRNVSFKIVNQGLRDVTSSFDTELYRVDNQNSEFVAFSGWTEGLKALNYKTLNHIFFQNNKTSLTSSEFF